MHKDLYPRHGCNSSIAGGRDWEDQAQRPDTV
jgi:hypothetical protein